MCETKPTFFWSYGDENTATFHCYSKLDVKGEIQSIAGCNLESDGDCTYVVMDTDSVDEALKELEEAGFPTQEQ